MFFSAREKSERLPAQRGPIGGHRFPFARRPPDSRGRRASLLADFAAGGMRLVGCRQIKPRLVTVLLVYAAGSTLLHLPLVMNTRLRIPRLEPLFVILAGAGWYWIGERWSP
jgi:hypothetical protein